MDYHEASLRAHEARERLEDAQPLPASTQTFYVITAAWEEWACNPDQLKELMDDATLGDEFDVEEELEATQAGGLIEINQPTPPANAEDQLEIPS